MVVSLCLYLSLPLLLYVVLVRHDTLANLLDQGDLLCKKEDLQEYSILEEGHQVQWEDHNLLIWVKE